METSRQAAEALRPLAGEWAYLLFTAGIVGTGFSPCPFWPAPPPSRWRSSSSGGRASIYAPNRVLVMLVGSNRAIMGEQVNGFWLNVLGWTATAVMTAAAVAYVVSALG